MGAAYLDFGEQPAYFGPITPADLQGYGNLNGNNASVKAVYSMWGAVADTAWINAGDIPVGCIQSIGDTIIPWNYSTSAGSADGVEAYGSNSIHSRAAHKNIYTTLYGYHSTVHVLGLNFPQIDTTLMKLTEFYYPLTK